MECCLPVYVLTPADKWIRTVYADWLHVNYGSHLDGLIDGNSVCQTW